MSLLEVRGLDVHYGDLQALFGVDVILDVGDTLAVIGANGAGKSTLLRTIAGQHRQTRGVVLFDGQPVDALPAHQRVPRGIALTPEGRRLFPTLTVEENLLVGAYRARTGPWRLDTVYDLFPLVGKLRHRPAANLSGGEQQAVAIGRSLMSNPRLLLLDEVSLGMAPVMVGQLYSALPTITGSGTTVLIVEQDLRQALAFADRVQCLLEGRTALQGRAGEVTREQVAAAYFGLVTNNEEVTR
jgi:branched-chain amino acid transport system ATP-binding protein